MDSPAGIEETSFRERLDNFLGICALAWALFALQYSFQGRWMTVSIDVVVASLTVALRSWVRLQPEKARLAAHVNILVSIKGLVLASLISGQGNSMAVWFLVTIPPFASYLLGIRAAAGWSCVAALGILFVQMATTVMPIPPEFVPIGWELALGRVALLAIMLALAGFSALVTERHLQGLAQAVRRAEDANLAKTQFLATMSHELRTPLNAVIGFGELLQATQGTLDPARQQKYVDNIVVSGRHLLSQVNDILELARLEAGQLNLERTRVWLGEILLSVVEATAPAAREKNISIEFPVLSELPSFESDPRKVRQIFEHIVRNAIKFTDAGGRVRLAAEVGAEEIVVSVTDNGVGIRKEDMELLFKRFQQLDSSYSRRYEGMGLGLALTKGLVEIQKGRIWATSPGPGMGSTFFVALPKRYPV